MDTDDAVGALVALLVAPALIPAGLTYALGSSGGAREWLLERGLIAPEQDAAFAIPGWDGAGVAKVHLLILACLIICLIAIGGSIQQRRKRKKIDIAGWGN